MPTVFPWSAESPLLAAGIVIGLAAYLLAVSLALGALRRRLLAADADAAPAGQWLPRVPRAVRRTALTGALWTVVLVSAYVFLYAATWVWTPLDELLFQPSLAVLPEVATLVAIVIGSRLTLAAISGLGRYAERGSKRHGGASPQVVHVLERFFRYVVHASAGIAILLVVLSIFGYSQNAETAVVDWLRTHAASLALLVTLIGIGWAGSRITRAVTGEVRQTSKRFSPEVVDAIGSVARGALFAVLTLVGIITVLNSVGQGSVAGTLVVVMTSFVGLAVAMAGTGSIGNALSGAVLVSFRPYEPGDRVVLLDDMICDVEEVSLMFTKVRTLAREMVEVPNNQVLAKRIVNLSRSGPHAMVVKLGIGYDVSHKLVRELATKAALATEGVLRDPAPKVHARHMGNYAIEYELYAYTRNPRHLEPRSTLLGNLQDTFYGAGVEIMTPDIYVLRKGKTAEAEGFVRVAVDAPLQAEDARTP